MKKLKTQLRQKIKDAKQRIRRAEKAVRACWREGAARYSPFDEGVAALLRTQQDLTDAETELSTYEEVLMDLIDAEQEG